MTIDMANQIGDRFDDESPNEDVIRALESVTGSITEDLMTKRADEAAGLVMQQQALVQALQIHRLSDEHKRRLRSIVKEIEFQQEMFRIAASMVDSALAALLSNRSHISVQC